MDFQICMCGVAPGYTHKPTCPFPYYGNSDRMIDKWLDGAERLLSKSDEEAKREKHSQSAIKGVVDQIY